MATYAYKARKKTPITEGTVDAPSHQAAIQMIIDTAAEGETIEVLSVVEQVPATAEGPTGTTGTTGTTGASGAAMSARASRAQLDEMTKDDLLTVAAKEGVEVNPHWNKSDIVDTIVKHRHR